MNRRPAAQAVVQRSAYVEVKLPARQARPQQREYTEERTQYTGTRTARSLCGRGALSGHVTVTVRVERQLKSMMAVVWYAIYGEYTVRQAR